MLAKSAGLNQESHSGLAKVPGSSEEIELWIKRLLGVSPE
jgi:hypothetical protein